MQYNTRNATRGLETRKHAVLHGLTDFSWQFSHSAVYRRNTAISLKLTNEVKRYSVDLHTHDILTDHRTRQRSLGHQKLIDRCMGHALKTNRVSGRSTIVAGHCDKLWRPDHSARSDSTGRSRLAVSCDPVFDPDVIISLLITTNEVNNVIGCRSLSR